MFISEEDKYVNKCFQLRSSNGYWLRIRANYRNNQDVVVADEKYNLFATPFEAYYDDPEADKKIMKLKVYILQHVLLYYILL